MGYIAPVTHYQYNQYAERDLIVDYDPFHFVPIAKINHTVNAHAFHQQLAASYSIKKSQRKQKRVRNKEEIKRDKIDRTYSEITGKGKNFSVSI